MGTYKCIRCQIAYPLVEFFDEIKRCYVCGHLLTLYTRISHNEDWDDKVRKLGGQVPYDYGVHPATAIVPIEVNDNGLWVLKQDLEKVGYTDIDDFDIIRINGKYYELLGETTEKWWIAECSTTMKVRTRKRNIPKEEAC